jgi:hypothetical protein
MLVGVLLTFTARDQVKPPSEEVESATLAWGPISLIGSEDSGPR